MALSETVQSSLNEASSSLRNALAYAARQERPHTCSSIAKVLLDIEQIQGIDSLLDTVERMQDEL